jgi:hypothetical protein
MMMAAPLRLEAVQLENGFDAVRQRLTGSDLNIDWTEMGSSTPPARGNGLFFQREIGPIKVREEDATKGQPCAPGRHVFDCNIASGRSCHVSGCLEPRKPLPHIVLTRDSFGSILSTIFSRAFNFGKSTLLSRSY